jgi:hypothetical protein
VVDDNRIIARRWQSPSQAATGSSVRSPPTRCGWVVLPSLLIGVPAAFRKQAVDIGQRAVAADEEPEAFAIRLAWPAPVPRFAARIAGVEADTAQGLAAAVRAALNVAAVKVLAAERDATVGTAFVFHIGLDCLASSARRLSVSRPSTSCRRTSRTDHKRSLLRPMAYSRNVPISAICELSQECLFFGQFCLLRRNSQTIPRGDFTTGTRKVSIPVFYFQIEGNPVSSP